MSGFGGFGTTNGGLFGAKAPETSSAPTSTTSGLTLGTPSTGTSLTFATSTFGSSGSGSSTFGSTGLFGTTSTTTTFGSNTSGTQGTGFTFGSPSTTLKPPTDNTTTATLGSSLNFNLPKTTSTTFGTPVSSTATTTSLFSLGTQGVTTAPSIGFGLNQTTSITQATGFTATTSFSGDKSSNVSLWTTTQSSTSAPSFRFTTPAFVTSSSGASALGSVDGGKVGTPGLGGVDKSQLSQGLSGPGAAEPKQVKDNILPDQILQTLNDFQNFTKQQKSVSVEISHGSSKPLKKVQEDTDVMESLLTMITSGLTRNALAVDKLKTETAQGLHQAEMAQRNHETPPGLDYESTAPAEYFNDLVTKFETDAWRLRVQIEASEKHLRSLTQSTSISPQELTLAMRRLHETLVVLAARVQTLHTTVQSQKEQYKNLRRVYLKDDSAIFDKETDHQHNRKQTIFSLHSLTGPTPFSETCGSGRPLNVDGLAMLAGTTATPIISTAANQGWITPLSASTGNISVLPGNTALQTCQPGVTTGFQLSKPPTGSKRNKR